MKDAYIMISRAKNLGEVEAALKAAGYMHDETRRSLMAAVDRSPIAKSKRAAAFAAVMGPVAGMQNASRCSDWWDRLVKSPEMTIAALDHGMPFAALLQDFACIDVIRTTLSDNFQESALLLWSRGFTDAQRAEVIDEAIDIIASNDLKNEEQWIAPTVKAIMGKPGIDQLRLAAHLLCEGWFFDKKDPRMGALWAQAFFPTGLSQEKFALMQSHIKANARNIAAAGEYVEGLMRGLVAEHDQRLLDENTQSPAKAAPARRI